MVSSFKTRSLPLLLLGLLTLTGCTGLILRETDTAQDTAGKVAARVLLCPITLCLSEVEIALIQDREAREARDARYWRWVESLPPEQQAIQYQLEAARIQAAGQALLGFGIGGGFFQGLRYSTMPAPMYQPRPLPVLPWTTPLQPQPPVSCSSRQVAGIVHTDCY